MKVLDIGAGDNPVENADTLDRLQKFNPDILQDITELPLRIEDNSYDKIIMKDVLEHLPNDADYLDQLFQELERVLKPDGKIYIRVPYYTSSCGAGDVQHSTNGYSHQFHLGYVSSGLEVCEKNISFKGKPTQFLEGLVNRFPVWYERVVGLNYIFPATNLEIWVRNKSSK